MVCVQHKAYTERSLTVLAINAVFHAANVQGTATKPYCAHRFHSNVRVGLHIYRGVDGPMLLAIAARVRVVGPFKAMYGALEMCCERD